MLGARIVVEPKIVRSIAYRIDIMEGFAFPDGMAEIYLFERKVAILPLNLPRQRVGFSGLVDDDGADFFLDLLGHMHPPSARFYTEQI